jgi:AGZA family xanthine/uracil permease-like MFS transporter
VKRFFDFDTPQTALKTEVLAGITSFLAAMYIIIVNPAILSAAGLPYAGALTATTPVIFVFLFAGLFDSLSTFIGVAEAADLKDDEGEPRNIKASLLTDAVSSTISGLLGSSAGSSYIESAAGIREGGRTGLTAVVAGLCFLPFMFFSPLLSVIPSIATAPALVLVGVFMMCPIAKFEWERYDEAIPAFLAIVLIPVTYSTTQGIVWGLISWTVLNILCRKMHEIPLTLAGVNVFAIAVLLV